ncbi:MAG: hypothetical protein ABFQ62_02885 [Patescibacteria group bacterium]
MEINTNVEFDDRGLSNIIVSLISRASETWGVEYISPILEFIAEE